MLEILKRISCIKSSTCNTATQEEIDEKERELGVVFPPALRELYLSYGPDNPIFKE